jgi:type I restriction enzyme S subunit
LVEVDPNGTLLSDKIWRFVWNDPVTVLPFYVWQVLQTPGIRSAIGSLATGTSGSMKNISQAKLLRLELPVPPMELQRVFEARIKESRRLAGECRRSLEELTSLFASLQHRAFRGEL